MSLTMIAETYLGLLRNGNPQTRMYVQLAYKYGVPVGCIVTLTGLPAAEVIEHIEGKESGERSTPVHDVP